MGGDGWCYSETGMSGEQKAVVIEEFICLTLLVYAPWRYQLCCKRRTDKGLKFNIVPHFNVHEISSYKAWGKQRNSTSQRQTKQSEAAYHPGVIHATRMECRHLQLLSAPLGLVRDEEADLVPVIVLPVQAHRQRELSYCL